MSPKDLKATKTLSWSAFGLLRVCIFLTPETYHHCWLTVTLLRYIFEHLLRLEINAIKGTVA